MLNYSVNSVGFLLNLHIYSLFIIHIYNKKLNNNSSILDLTSSLKLLQSINEQYKKIDNYEERTLENVKLYLSENKRIKEFNKELIRDKQNLLKEEEKLRILKKNNNEIEQQLNDELYNKTLILSKLQQDLSIAKKSNDQIEIKKLKEKIKLEGDSKSELDNILQNLDDTLEQQEKIISSKKKALEIDKQSINEFRKAEFKAKIFEKFESVFKNIPLIGDKLGNSFDRIGDKIRAKSLSKSKNQDIAGEAKKQEEVITEEAEELEQLSAQDGLLGKVVTKLAPIGIAIGVVFSSTLGFMFSMDKQISKIAKNFGVSYEQAIKLRAEAGNISNSFKNINSNSGEVLEVISSLNEKFGILATYSKDLIENQLVLTKRMGLSVDEASKISELSLITGKNSKQLTIDILNQTNLEGRKTKLMFDQRKILKEVATTSNYIKGLYQNNVKSLTEAVLKSNELGLNLDKMRSISESLLDFESSINNELEAELITGKSLNFEKARELSLNGDIAGATQELMKQITNFDKMNVIQKQSISKAVGLTVDELSDSINHQIVLNKLGAKNEDQLKEAIKLKASGNKLSAEQELILSKLNNSGEESYKNYLENQSVVEALSEAWDKIKDTIGTIFIQSGLMEKLHEFTKWISSPENFNKILDKVLLVVDGLLSFSQWFVFWDVDDGIQKMRDGIEDMRNEYKNNPIEIKTTTSSNPITIERLSNSNNLNTNNPNSELLSKMDKLIKVTEEKSNILLNNVTTLDGRRVQEGIIKVDQTKAKFV